MAMERTDITYSSNIAAVAYDKETQELEVTFRSGATYAYSGVSEDIAGALASATSPGSLFNSAVKGNYPTRRIG